MLPAMPDDLEEARALLDAFWITTDHAQRLHEFREGLALVQECLLDTGAAPHDQRFTNMQTTYARKFLEAVGQLPPLDYEDWCAYAEILLTLDVEAVLAQHPGLQTAAQHFLRTGGYRDRYVAELERQLRMIAMVQDRRRRSGGEA